MNSIYFPDENEGEIVMKHVQRTLVDPARTYLVTTDLGKIPAIMVEDQYIDETIIHDGQGYCKNRASFLQCGPQMYCILSLCIKDKVYDFSFDMERDNDFLCEILACNKIALTNKNVKKAAVFVLGSIQDIAFLIFAARMIKDKKHVCLEGES